MRVAHTRSLVYFCKVSKKNLTRVFFLNVSKCAASCDWRPISVLADVKHFSRYLCNRWHNRLYISYDLYSHVCEGSNWPSRLLRACPFAESWEFDDTLSIFAKKCKFFDKKFSHNPNNLSQGVPRLFLNQVHWCHLACERWVPGTSKHTMVWDRWTCAIDSVVSLIPHTLTNKVQIYCFKAAL